MLDRNGLYILLMDVGEGRFGEESGRSLHSHGRGSLCLKICIRSLHLRRKDTWMLGLERVLYFEEQCPIRSDNGRYLRATAS